MGAMLRLTDIKLPLDHRPEALKAAILKKLKLPEDALLDWKIFKRAHDARNKQAIALIYSLDVAVADEAGLLKRFERDPETKAAHPRMSVPPPIWPTDSPPMHRRISPMII